jgi:hypothetical protein
MVFPARCPALKCRKYMLVEAADRGKVVACLLCKTPIRVPTGDGPPTPTPTPAAPLPVARLLSNDEP